MIVVTTPTGNTGRKVLQQLLDSELSPVRIVIRDRTKLPSRILDRVDIVDGSLEDPATLRQAFTRADALFWCQPDSTTAPDYVASYEDLALKARAAINESGLSHVVAISAAGEPPARPAGPITALHHMEAILAESRASIRFLRCGSFMENLLWQWDYILQQGSFTYSLPSDILGPQVCAADIARVATRYLPVSDWRGVEAVPVLGPQDLSFMEMAEIMSHHLERPVIYEPMEPDAYHSLLIAQGLSPSAAQGLVDMFSFLENGFSVAPSTPRTDTPTTFSQWLMRDS